MRQALLFYKRINKNWERLSHFPVVCQDRVQKQFLYTQYSPVEDEDMSV